jgi:thiol-disulfide isomerase/thioredoxin
MKHIALTLLLCSLLFAYQKNDVIDEQLQKTLGIKENKVYIIDFFASWCDSCEKEIPYISKVHEKIDSKKVEIIGIDVDKDASKAEAFQQRLQAHNHLNFKVINDPQNTIIKAFEPIGMPALFYVQNGKVMNVIYGAIDNIDDVILNDLKEMGL